MAFSASARGGGDLWLVESSNQENPKTPRMDGRPNWMDVDGPKSPSAAQ